MTVNFEGLPTLFGGVSLIYRSGVCLVGISSMAHVRRKFDEAKENDLNLSQNALLLIQRLYLIEKKYVSRQPLPMTDTLPKSAMGQVIQYTLSRIEKLRYTEQAYLQLDNNLVENVLQV